MKRFIWNNMELEIRYEDYINILADIIVDNNNTNKLKLDRNTIIYLLEQDMIDNGTIKQYTEEETKRFADFVLEKEKE